MERKRFQRARRAVCFCGAIHVTLLIDELRQSAADERMIIHDENTRLLLNAFHGLCHWLLHRQQDVKPPNQPVVKCFWQIISPLRVGKMPRAARSLLLSG